jgi:pimeloyl-ACP methyl ester carboxylesterase
VEEHVAGVPMRAEHKHASQRAPVVQTAEPNHAREAALKEGWIEGDVRLHYVEWCAGDRARGLSLLLLHGTSSNALYWSRLARRLTDHRTVALDLRGHGRSGHPASGYTVDDMAADAAQALTSLGLSRSLVVGHSWGVAVGLHLGAARPDLIMGAVLVDGPVSPLSTCLTWEEAERQMRTPSPAYQDLAEAEAAQAALLDGAWGEDLRDFVRAGFRRSEVGWVPVLEEGPRLQMLRSLYDFRPNELLAKVAGPVRMVMGSDSRDGVAPAVLGCWRAGARTSVDVIRRGRLVTYESQHDVPLIQPVELATDVEQTMAEAAG